MTHRPLPVAEVVGPPVEASDALLAVEDLHVEFDADHGVVHAVEGVSFSVKAGQTVAILGESGSGKSVTARAIMGLTVGPKCRVTSGSIRFGSVDLLTLSERERRRLRGSSIAMIFQDALSALNPVLSVGYQIAEVFRIHQHLSRKDARRRAIEMLDLVKIPAAASRVDHFPHQFSGGMRQRVMIAMALAGDPELVIADEPTTALDVTVQAQIIELLMELQATRKMALVLITHDIGVVAEVADRVVVMYAGRVAEQGPAKEICNTPAHPYTRALLDSIPRPELRGRPLPMISGSPPDPMAMPDGCPFAPRCGYTSDRCLEALPPNYSVIPGHASACHKWEATREL